MKWTKPLLLFVIVPLIAGCLPGRLVYHSESYRGRVVDAETRRPLAGAAVVAVWHQETVVLLVGHGPALDYHDALEMVTDTLGEFEFPERTQFTLFGKILEPKFVAYYSGYVPYPTLGTQPQGDALDLAYQHRVFEIELPKAKTREDRGRQADRPLHLDHRVPEGKTPTLMTLINKERQDLGLRPIGERDRGK